MLEKYWPTKEEVEYCIRTEAEESAEHVLLAVHEPMILKRLQANSDEGEYKNESDLLDHFLNTERPIPILGEAGVGKSHLIRWLDAKLKVHPQAIDWKICRIPKNVSLANVLEIFLDGLEGKDFDEVRNKIRNVKGKQIKPEFIADYLIVSVSSSLDELYDQAMLKKQELRNNPDLITDELRKRIDVLGRHAKPEALPLLLGDVNYKPKLVSSGKCLYQISKRILQGSNDEELVTSEYQLNISDLNFKDIHIGDLAQKTQKYINDVSFEVMEERRQEAVDLLNEVLSEAIRKTFQFIFGFHGDTFQELFTEIRRYLKKQGKTLVVLIEDMAQISAIEDVLLDSLTLEGMREGIQELCSVRSAIAVTWGYPGYLRRKKTLVSRSNYEWIIEDKVSNSVDIYKRVEDFCGRYLNAARHGKEFLKDSYDPKHLDEVVWPPVFHSNDVEEQELVQAFGVSESQHPLFPFNAASIRALTNKYCFNHGELNFNPRTILRNILLEILKPYRDRFLSHEFPPPKFLDINCPTSLARQIDANIHDDIERSFSLSAIWGDGSEDLPQLAGIMNPKVADVFSCPDLFNVLTNTKAVKPAGIPEPNKVVSGTKSQPKPVDVVTTNDPIDTLKEIGKQVDTWFKEESIPQKYANSIRQTLLAEIQKFWSFNFNNWYGMHELPKLSGKNNQPLIRIPFNPNNPSICLVSFGSENDFRNTPLKYTSFITSLLRYVENSGWEYEDGYLDQCAYLNFLSEWLPNAVIEIAFNKREKISKNSKEIVAHLSQAFVFEPRINNFTLPDKLSYLCQSSENLKEKFPTTGIEIWDTYKDGVMENWEKTQSAWLNAYSVNYRAIEGDLVLSLLRGESDLSVPGSMSKTAQASQNYIKGKFPSFSLLEGCTDKEQYTLTFKTLLELITRLKGEHQFRNVEEGLTAQKFINRIKIILENDYWMTAKSVISLHSTFEPIKVITALNSLNLVHAELIEELLSNWKTVFSENLSRMKDENLNQGGDKRIERKKHIDDSIYHVTEIMSAFEGVDK